MKEDPCTTASQKAGRGERRSGEDPELGPLCCLTIVDLRKEADWEGRDERQ
jgi:hypothetical protein